MKQMTINCHDSFNFYSYAYYLNERNEYGEYLFDAETNRLKITKAELRKLISARMGVPFRSIEIFDYSSIKAK